MRKTALGLTLLVGFILLSTTSSVVAQGVRAVVTSEVANIRIFPEFGAEVRGNVPAGFLIEPVTGRSGDNMWLRFNFAGDEGWIHISTLTVLDGDFGALPVRDPRTIPFGGFEAPRAGSSGNFEGPAAQVRDWLRVRSGPGLGYVIIANAPINTQVPMLGRTASSNWIQVNYEGTLGWVSREWLIFSGGFALANLPIDGIVADAPPSGDNANDFIGILQLMRARLDLAQPSLDIIRAYWTDSALTGRAACKPYPARPSDISIQTPLLAANFNTLEPLRVQFNDAMFNVRLSIDLFIDACNQPGTANPVGQATVMGALDVVSLADRQFADLRGQLDALIPPPLDLGAGQCLLSFANSAEVLPIIGVGQLALETFSSRDTVVGYCFDATAGQTLFFDVLQRPGGNAAFLLTVSLFDNPSNFLAVGRSSAGQESLRVGPLVIPQTGRYLLVISNYQFPAEGAALSSSFGALVFESIGTGGGGLIYDPASDQINVLVPIPVIEPTAAGGGGGGICPNLSFTCEQLTSCEQAFGCFQLGNVALDSNGNGVPCDEAAVPLCTPPG